MSQILRDQTVENLLRWNEEKAIKIHQLQEELQKNKDTNATVFSGVTQELRKQIETLQAENARLKAMPTEAECYAFQAIYGDHMLNRYWIKRALENLFATRAALKETTADLGETK